MGKGAGRRRCRVGLNGGTSEPKFQVVEKRALTVVSTRPGARGAAHLAAALLFCLLTFDLLILTANVAPAAQKASALETGVATPCASRASRPAAYRLIWDPPAVPCTPDHDDVVRDENLLPAFLRLGEQLFRAKFNVLDGAGRPEATGDSKPTTRARVNRLFQRLAGPDANSCAGCHNQPFAGGSGDFVANAFVGAHFTDPPTESIASEVTNERNTISIFGGGAIETVAREMTEDLLALRDQAAIQAAAKHREIAVRLETKGVSFGRLVVRSDGTFDTTQVRGIDDDLVVKPFGAKGVAVSIREFTNFALNQHHGMESVERFGWERTGADDFDGDGVKVEMTVGQVSALTLWQASLPPPSRSLPNDAALIEKIRLGERKFANVGCTNCHVARLPLRSIWFLEPNPFNRPGSLVPSDVAGALMIPIEVRTGSGVFLGDDGQVYVAAYTDLKRHKICDADDPFYCNEKVPQDFVPTDEFLTAKLWDCGSSAPYGHRGDLTTVSEAILHHSGEARATRNAFLALNDAEKESIVDFLLSLTIQKGDSDLLTDSDVQPKEAK
jgi:Di-haem oxidoreductase, putative peroxidase